MFHRATELLIAVATLSTVAAGCSSDGGGPPLASASGTPTASAAQLTGVQLRAALLPPSDFPPGYGVQGEQDSGASLAGSRTGVDLGTMSCTHFVSHSLVAVLGATAYAVEYLRSSDRSVEYTQLIWQFTSPVDAARIYGGMRALANRCPKTSMTSGGVAEQVTIQAQAPAPVGGHGAVEIDETVTVSTVSGATATFKTLWCADGADLLEVGVATSTQGVSASQSPPFRTLMHDLIASVLAARRTAPTPASV